MISFITKRKLLLGLIELAFCLVGSFAILIVVSPVIHSLTDRDAGVFLYIGEKVLQGKVPYRDIWDHKPPLVYFINAAGLWLGQRSLWGIWSMELLSLCITVWLGFRLVKEWIGRFVSISTVVLFLCSLLPILGGGNTTEEFALPFQVGCLYLFWRAQVHSPTRWTPFLIGLLTGVAFLIKQNTIGVGLSILLYWVTIAVRNRKVTEAINGLCYFLFGATAAITPICIYFFRNGALGFLWDGAFQYNQYYLMSAITDTVYQSVGWMEGFLWKIKSAFYGLERLSQIGLAFLGFVGAGLGITSWLSKRPLPAGSIPLTLVLIIDLPLELALSSSTGRPYGHYYIACLPVFSFLAAITIEQVISACRSDKPSFISHRLIPLTILLGILLPFIRPYYETIQNSPRGTNSIVEFIMDHTVQQDTVIIWGAEVQDLFLSNRSSPTRFAYQYPLYMPGYTDGQLIEEFLGNIVDNKPKYILDSRNPKTPLYQFPLSTPRIQEQIGILKTIYLKSGELAGWDIYELSEPSELPAEL